MTNKKKRVRRSVLWKIDKDELQKILDSSNTYGEVLEFFKMSQSCGNYKTLNQVIKEYDLSLSKINEQRIIKASNHTKTNSFNKRNDEDIFCKNSTYLSRGGIKKRLLLKGFDYECAECKINDIYNDKPISLQLDHINGINDDNRLNNLRFLCPNCHSQTETFSGKRHKKTNYCECGNIISNKANFCFICRPTKPTKIDWPSVEEMSKLVWEKPATHLSKDLGISDVAIKKFCIKNTINVPPKGYWLKKKLG
jgi:5-methylcytosine-specific restriction endonuclease McrA